MERQISFGAIMTLVGLALALEIAAPRSWEPDRFNRVGHPFATTVSYAGWIKGGALLENLRNPALSVFQGDWSIKHAAQARLFNGRPNRTRTEASQDAQ